MGTGYVRQDVSNNIASGNVIQASDLDGEFDAVEAAFHASTGHTHDGTIEEGAPITVVGPAQEWVVDGTALYPKTDNTYDLGKTGAEIKDLFVDGTANIDALVADTADINGGTLDGVIIGGAATAAATVTTLSATTSATTPDLTTTTSVDFSGATVSNLGTVTTADINGGTLDGVIIGGAATAAATVTTLSATTSATTPDLTTTTSVDFSGATVSNLGTVTTADINGGTLDGVIIGGASAAAATVTGLTVTSATPLIILNETDGNVANAQNIISLAAGSLGIGYRSSTGVSPGYFDYFIGRTTGGANVHEWRVGVNKIFQVDAAGIDVTGAITATADSTFTAGLKLDGDSLYCATQLGTATGVSGFRLLSDIAVQRGDFIFDGSTGQVEINTYSSLGAALSKYNFTEAVFDVDTGTATNNGINFYYDGVRRLTIKEGVIQGFDSDGTTQALNLPLKATGSEVFGCLPVYNATIAGAANVNVDSNGFVRRSTSSGEFKVSRETVLSRTKATGRPTEQDTGSLIDALQPVSFESTHEGDNSRRFTGFIAEEVAEVYPEASADDGQNYDIRALVGILWVEVQELRKRVVTLESRGR